MKRRFQGLHEADRSATNEVPEGLHLVRVTQAQYRWHAQKPFYILCFTVIEPKEHAGCFFTGRIYCTPRALWKFSWLLRDFGYDTELLGRDEIDDKNLIGPRGVVKVSHKTLNGASLLNLDGFAPEAQLVSLSSSAVVPDSPSAEVAG